MWNEQRVSEFWKHNKSSYAGDTNASEIIRLSKKYMKGKALDVGAGSGALVNQLSNAIGIDIIPHFPKVVEGSIAQLPFKDNEFDIVFITNVLEHLPDNVFDKGLQEIFRVLNVGGVIIVVIPYKEDLTQNMVLCPVCKVEFHRWGHVRSFDETVIVSRLNAYGFKVIKLALLPLGLMAQHWLIRYVYPLFVRVGFIEANDLFVVARK